MIKKYEADPPQPGLNYAWHLVSTTYEEKMLSYMRWGWHGKYDGWYKSTVLTPAGNLYVNTTYVAVCDN